MDFAFCCSLGHGLNLLLHMAISLHSRQQSRGRNEEGGKECTSVIP